MIRVQPLPANALLRAYAESGAYTDCYSTDVAGDVSHAQLVEAFYCTRVFRLERWILRVFAGRPSSDAEARALATGASDAFAAWTVEGRSDNQLLLCDVHRRTRSWLMCERLGTGAPLQTRLYFGSAVVPVRDASGRMRLGWLFSALIGFHRVYSRMLLGAAVRRMRRRAT